MSNEAMKRALNALEILERFLDPLAKWQIKKPKFGGPVITVYPQKVAKEAISDLRQAIAEAEKREWVGLKEQDIHDAFQFTELIKQLDFYRDRQEWCENFAAHLEAKLKEKNT